MSLAFAAALAVAVSGIALTGVREASASTTLTVSGHGWGHGQGMGQWGAEGYALQGWTYQQILSHYYGGTALTADSTAPAQIQVQLTELSGSTSLTVSVGSGAHLVVDGAATTATSTKLTSGHYASSSTGGDVTLTFGGKAHLYPGTISLSSGQVDDKVSLLQYVEGVVPFESEASWNAQALEAQAVAARSYALAVTANGSKPICDSTACQVFGGDPSQIGPDAADSNTAVKDTYSGSAPLVLFCTAAYAACGASGSVALTQYSASTGGYTSGGLFPAVVDAGDTVAPEHDWTTSLSLSAVQSAFPALGTIESVTVTQRNGLGDMGGRVLELAVTGTKGSESVTGSYFASELGLDSDWFWLSAPAPAAPVATPPPPPGHAVAMAGSPDGKGYWIVSSGGYVYSYGDARFYGDEPGAAITAFVPTSDRKGYWLVSSAGAVYAFGDAHNYGSETSVSGHVSAVFALSGGKGYWLVSSKGSVYTFGAARSYGSLARKKFSGSVVAGARSSDGKGYWLVTSTGGIYGFGDARSFGSLKGVKTVTAMSSIPSNKGHWLASTAGGVYVFGPAKWYKSLSGKTTSLVAIAGSADGKGYWLLTSNGGVTSFGDAHEYGHPAL